MYLGNVLIETLKVVDLEIWWKLKKYYTNCSYVDQSILVHHKKFKIVINAPTKLFLILKLLGRHVLFLPFLVSANQITNCYPAGRVTSIFPR